MATILAITNEVQDQLGLPRSSAIISASDTSTRQFYGLLKQLGRDLRKEIEWPQLNRQYQFALAAVGTYTGDTVAGTASITNLSSTTGITTGMIISSQGWNGIGAAANQVRVVTLSGTTVTTNIAASTDETADDISFAQDQYALPNDFDEAVQRTHWDRSNRWELVGPLTPQQWQWQKSGIIAKTPRRRFRIKGLQDNKFNVDPPPGVSENGQYLAFEYQSRNWIRPPVWVTGATYAAASYTFYNGNFYSTTSGGTTGATPPTHISGTVSDGGVSWAYFDGVYADVGLTSDSSEPLIDFDLIVLGLKYYWRKAKRLYFDDLEAEFEKKKSLISQSLRGAAMVNMEPNITPSWLLTTRNIGDTGYGSTP